MRPDTGTLRALIIDDDATIRRLVAATLADAGFRGTEAAHGAEALDRVAAEQHPFDLVVLDLQMPVMDGAAFFERFRADGHRTPVLVLSAYNPRPRGQKFAPEATMAKPFDLDDLVRVARRLAAGRFADADADAPTASWRP
jgi:two-component system OmpR family response regulator